MICTSIYLYVLFAFLNLIHVFYCRFGLTALDDVSWFDVFSIDSMKMSGVYLPLWEHKFNETESW